MLYEKEYINYLIEHVSNIDTDVLDSYFRNEVSFNAMLSLIDTTQYDIKSYKNFVKSKKIDEHF